MDQPLLATADPALAEELSRLAAAAGEQLTLVSTAADALAGWSAAPVVLVGADLAARLVDLAPPPRPAVHVVSWSPAPVGAFRDALLVGAERVVELPAGAPLVAELLTDLGEPGRGTGELLAVAGGSGGAGATVLACALAQVAADSGPALVVDLDPLGPGCDRVLALDEAPGVRWDSLGSASGRLSGRSLREAVPRRGELGVLAWPQAPMALDPRAVRETLSAGVRGHRTVVVDLPRAGELVAETVARSSLAVLVVVPSVAGVAAAARWVAQVGDHPRLAVVVRGRAVEPERVAAAVGAPVLASMPDQRGVAEAIDLGLGPARSRRGPLVSTARTLLAAAARGAAA